MSSTADSAAAVPGSQAARQLSGGAALADLRQRWGDAYEIACVETWTARVPREEDVLTASTAAGLESLICQHHSARRASARPGSPDANMGQGERALRQLRDDGVI